MPQADEAVRPARTESSDAPHSNLRGTRGRVTRQAPRCSHCSKGVEGYASLVALLVRLLFLAAVSGATCITVGAVWARRWILWILRTFTLGFVSLLALAHHPWVKATLVLAVSVAVADLFLNAGIVLRRRFGR